MASSPLVTTDWLESHLDDPDLRIIEICSVDDDKTYHEAHIPGAMWLFWKAACWQATDRDLITPNELAELFGRLGIRPDSTVVLYGDPIQFVCYAYWAFSMAGHTNLRLLVGGRKKWLRDRRPVSQKVPRFATKDYAISTGS